MRSISFELLLQLFVLLAFATADIVYITDLPNYSLLAPCAASAIKYAVNSLTYSKCPEAVTALESCACTKDNNGALVASTISSDVLSYCGATASEDVNSASIVFDNYCNQDQSAAAFPVPQNPVTQYITDLPAYSDLAPCAGSGLSYAMYSLTYSKCPAEATALAPCLCSRNQNSLLMSQLIGSEVRDYCGTAMTEDVNSAHAVFSGYCGLNNGTSNFPARSEVTAMTYYITDMQEYSALAPCAQSAVYYNALYSLTNTYCPSGPGAIASCACMKGENSGMVQSLLKSGVSDYCSSTGEDLASASGVFEFYCSAAKGLVNPAGITTSAQTTPYSTVNSGSTKTGTSRFSSGATKTGSSSNSTGTGTSTGSDNGSNPTTKKKKSTVPIGAIVGGIVGGVIFIFALLAGIWLYRQNKLRAAPGALGVAGYAPHHDIPPSYGGKAELASTVVAPIPAPSASMRKPVHMSSPVPSAVSAVTQEKPGEMESRAPPLGWNGAGIYHERPGSAYEMQGRSPGVQGNPFEVQGSQRDPRHEMDGVGANLNEGPVYEMPGQQRWR